VFHWVTFPEPFAFFIDALFSNSLLHNLECLASCGNGKGLG
jgi:hypothetical protein